MTPREKEKTKAWVHSLVEKAFAEGATIQGIQFGNPVEEDRTRMIAENPKAIVYKRTGENCLTMWWRDDE